MKRTLAIFISILVAVITLTTFACIRFSTLSEAEWFQWHNSAGGGEVTIQVSLNNNYLDLIFPTKVYGDSALAAAVKDASFSAVMLDSAGNAGQMVVNSIKQANGHSSGTTSALAGGETRIRCFIDTDSTADGTERYRIRFDKGVFLDDGRSIPEGVLTSEFGLTDDSASWQELTPGLSDTWDLQSHCDIAVTSTGVVYVAYADNLDNVKLRRYTGTEWDSAYTWTLGQSDNDKDIKIEIQDNMLYLAYITSLGDLAVYAGELTDQPQPLGSDVDGNTGSDVAQFDICVKSDGTPVVVCTFSSDNTPIVRQYNNGLWHYVLENGTQDGNTGIQDNCNENAKISISTYGENEGLVIFYRRNAYQHLITSFESGTSWDSTSDITNNFYEQVWEAKTGDNGVFLISSVGTIELYSVSFLSPYDAIVPNPNSYTIGSGEQKAMALYNSDTLLVGYGSGSNSGEIYYELATEGAGTRTNIGSISTTNNVLESSIDYYMENGVCVPVYAFIEQSSYQLHVYEYK